MRGHDIIVIGTSMGGLEPLKCLVEQLPADLPAALFIVQHTSRSSAGLLADILDRAGPLTATTAKDGEEIRHGWIYTSPPDRHLLVQNEHIRVIAGPRENGHRPAVDPLFRSAAVAHGTRTVGVILSGLQDDGTAGLLAVKRCGGVAVVQDPTDAPYPEMPQSALAEVDVDHCLPVSAMGPLIEQLARTPAKESIPIPDQILLENELSARLMSVFEKGKTLGKMTPFVCPNCGGTLSELQDNDFIRYRCNVGHTYTARTLISDQSQSVEQALWYALRMLEERAKIFLLMARKDRDRGRDHSADNYENRARESQRHARSIKELILHLSADSEGKVKD